MAHYSAAGVAGGRFTTAHWSNTDLAAHATYVRAGCAHYGNCFQAGWYGRYPGAWAAGGWLAGNAWTAATWGTVASWCAVPDQPVYYDYGTTVVYQGDNVTVNGAAPVPAEQYAQQATTLADQGRQAQPPTDEKWQALGVFALVQGEEKTSNTLFQIAVDQSGTIRGNYYDGLMDQTTPIYGSVDKKTQRAAWSIGDKKDRVFEAGIANLTKDQTPVLIHMGTDKTQQLLLVRLQDPKGQPTQQQ